MTPSSPIFQFVQFRRPPRHFGPWLFLMAFVCGLFEIRGATTNSFVNWETAPVHPIDLAPDGNWLAVCNLPEARVEIFSVSGNASVTVASIPVGLDPTSVRFRGTNEI